jgi:hypothetical protein
MQVTKYIQKQYPAKIEEMQFTFSIGELKKDFESEVILRDEIMKIAASYLSLNIKSKSINTDAGLILVVDFIIEECSNLELQEINFIFRSGIMGKFGVIYNDISIDTICGKEGWIESYYRDYRKYRSEKKTENIVRLTGKEMTMEQFHAKNPEFKIKYDLHGIYGRAKKFETTIEDAKQFYKIKGLSDGDFKDDFQCFAKEYQNQKLIKCEILFITESFRKLIIQNVFKTKE